VYVGNKCRKDFGDITFTESDGATIIDQFLEKIYNAGVSDYTRAQALTSVNGPCAFYYNGATYFVYMSDKMDVYVRKYTIATTTWSSEVKIVNGPNWNDAHHFPVLCVDSSGYIHVYYINAGAAGGTIKHYKSNNSEDISAWTVQADIGAGDANLYQSPVVVGAEIYLFYTVTQASGGRGYAYRLHSEAYANRYNLTDFGNQNVFYPAAPKYDITNGRIHIGWCNYDAAGSGVRENIYHAYLRTSDKKLFSMGGTDLSGLLPLSKANGNTHCLALDSAVHECHAASLSINSSGYPYIGSVVTEDDVNFIHKVSYWNGAVWTTETITNVNSTLPWFYNCINATETVVEAYLPINGSMEKWTKNPAWAKNKDVWRKPTSTNGSNWINDVSVPSIVWNYNGTGPKYLFCEINSSAYASGDWLGPKRVLTTDSNDTTIDSGTYAIFWVKVPTIPISPGTQTIYIYYGNNDDTVEYSDITTFEFIDTFELGEITTWGTDATYNNPTWTNEQKNALQGLRSQKLYSSAPLTGAKNKALTLSNTKELSFWIILNSTHQDFTLMSLDQADYGVNHRFAYIYFNSTVPTMGYWDGTTSFPQFACGKYIWYHVRLFNFNYTADTYSIRVYDERETLMSSVDNAGSVDNLASATYINMGDYGGTIDDVSLDEFVLREHTTNEPAHSTWGLEEDIGDTGSSFISNSIKMISVGLI